MNNLLINTRFIINILLIVFASVFFTSCNAITAKKENLYKSKIVKTYCSNKSVSATYNFLLKKIKQCYIFESNAEFAPVQTVIEHKRQKKFTFGTILFGETHYMYDAHVIKGKGKCKTKVVTYLAGSMSSLQADKIGKWLSGEKFNCRLY